jgi:hypothetical protein
MDFGDAATAIGLILTAAGLVYAGRQLQLQRRLARGDFILRLEEMLASHNDVHRRLDAPGGRSWQPTEEDWPAVEAYMGTFERIELLVRSGILDLETVDNLYAYPKHRAQRVCAQREAREVGGQGRVLDPVPCASRSTQAARPVEEDGRPSG